VYVRPPCTCRTLATCIAPLARLTMRISSHILRPCQVSFWLHQADLIRHTAARTAWEPCSEPGGQLLEVRPNGYGERPLAPAAARAVLTLDRGDAGGHAGSGGGDPPHRHRAAGARGADEGVVGRRRDRRVVRLNLAARRRPRRVRGAGLRHRAGSRAAGGRPGEPRRPGPQPARRPHPWPPGRQTRPSFVRDGSLRTAAAGQHMHHSSIANRLRHVEAVLGIILGDPAGRIRAPAAAILWGLSRVEPGPGA
jgi:hypothetical protein